MDAMPMTTWPAESAQRRTSPFRVLARPSPYLPPARTSYGTHVLPQNVQQGTGTRKRTVCRCCGKTCLCFTYSRCSTCCRQIVVPRKKPILKPGRKWNKPFFIKLLESKNDEFRCTKMLFEFPFGLILFYVLYRLIIHRLRLYQSQMIKIGLLMILGGASMFTMFATFRCVTFLTVPTLTTYPGRLFLNAIMIQNILEGPVNNMIFNVQEAGHTFVCAFRLHSNHTMTQWQLRLVPIVDIVIQLQRNAIGLMKKCQAFVAKFLPINLEVTDQKETGKLRDETNQIDRELQQSSRTQFIKKKHRNGLAGRVAELQRWYREKLDLRCNDIFSKGIMACKQAFYRLESDCLDKVPVIGLVVCLPFKMSFICELLRLFTSVLQSSCDSLDAIQKGFEKSFDKADKVATSLDSQFDAVMQFKMDMSETLGSLDEGEEDENSMSLADMKSALDNKLKHQTEIIVFFVQLFVKLTPFVFVYLIYGAHTYLINYITDLRYDNKYVNSYFIHVDKRRTLQGKKTLLPLKKLEMVEVNHMFSWHIAEKDRNTVIDGTLNCIYKALFLLVILLIDQVFFEVLDLVARYGHVDYHQEGVHHIGLFLKGDGLVAGMLQIMFNGLNSTHTINSYTSSEECLPHPIGNTLEHVRNLALFVFAEWLCYVLEPYANRMRSFIAGFFYVKRNKQRTLHLYNEMLRKRFSFLQQVRHRVRKKSQNAQLQVDIGFLSAIRYLFPRMCAWTKIFQTCGFGRQMCLICEERETSDFIRCPTKGCKAVYCAECWHDVHMKCYACRDEDDWTYTNDADSVDALLVK